jgi:DNA-binding response OmpR family regulator
MAKILLATAHASVRQHYVDVLALDGHTFEILESGRAFKEALRQGLPDLIISDVDLPGLDAFELVETLQEICGGRAIPPLVMRSNKDGEEEQRFVWMGGEETPEDLRALVRARLAAAETRSKHGRILVVDDDWSLRKSLQVRLEKDGYEVITAMDGEEGLERLKEMPDLVLTDIDMPRLDGLGMLQRLRAEKDYNDIPVIMMTAHATGGEEAAEGLDLGANDYVRKPFDWRELSARVQTQIRIREVSQLTAEKQRDLAIIELAGAAAHEINNPLAVIMARLELMLSDTDEQSKTYKNLEQIDHLIHRIAGVVKKMSQVRRYQVQNYCGGVNILDLDASSRDSS